MENKLALLIFLVIVNNVVSQLERDRSIIIPEPYYKDPIFFPDEIKEKFAEYTSLVEKENTCNLVVILETHPDKIKDKVVEKACIPDHHTLSYLLEEGHIDVAYYIIENIYLPNDIDPTDIVNTWVSKTEAKSRHILDLLNKKIRKPIKPKFSFINNDNTVTMLVKLIDDNLLPDKIQTHCYKDMIIIRGVFNKKGEEYALKERRTLYDEVESDCNYNFHAYASEIEITLIKKNKLKKWDSLFKTNK